jgi:hypothetical protein
MAYGHGILKGPNPALYRDLTNELDNLIDDVAEYLEQVGIPKPIKHKEYNNEDATA